MARDIETYLKELQTALAGADPALVQDALFDAEEHLQSEVAAGRGFAEVVVAYGSPLEVAAAYLGTEGGAAAGAARLPIAPSAESAPGAAGAPGASPTPPACATQAPSSPSAWKQIFGVFCDAHVWRSMLYMLISLGTGIAYFAIVVSMMSASLGTSVLIVGVPLLMLTLALVRGMALFEGRLVEVLLGARMPRRPRAEFPGSFFQRLWFWLKDGRTWPITRFASPPFRSVKT